MTITGTGFSNGTTSVSIGGLECFIKSITGTTIECITPKQAAGTKFLAVIVGTSTVMLPSSYTYDAAKTPSITTIRYAHVIPKSQKKKLCQHLENAP